MVRVEAQAEEADSNVTNKMDEEGKKRRGKNKKIISHLNDKAGSKRTAFKVN